MKSGEARLLLGFPPNSRPTYSQVKTAYRRKVWDVHPDRFPADKRSYAESQFKMISEAYNCLLPVGLGGLNVIRTYRKEKEANPSHNPFLP
ncbi:hypothetical protein BVRB_5g122640 [Beta vulgaris subsp. vulgaris]|nr:hypothetical protein BVRB_5g122640 [Beta vulgaris subsp. vulgaris]